MQQFVKLLTPLEKNYFRLYASAAKRDYSKMRLAAQLMDPKELSVLCATKATNLACDLDDLHAEFDEHITRLQGKHKFRRKIQRSSPTEDELLDLVTASFFKLVAALKTSDDDAEGAYRDAGWFSGSQESWKTNLSAIKAALIANTEKIPEKPITPLVAAMQLLFNAFTGKHQSWEADIADFLLPKFYTHSSSAAALEDDDEDYDDDAAAPEEYD